MTVVSWMVEKVAWLLGPKLVQPLDRQEIAPWGLVQLRLVNGHVKAVRVPVTGSPRPTAHSVCVGRATAR